MIILSIRTDKPEAEIGLFSDCEQLAYVTWEAHRALAETLHSNIAGLLEAQAVKLTELQAIAAYKGPGSFTGLRIGLSVANALAAGLGIPIAGQEGEQWMRQSLQRLLSGENDKIVLPEYGAPVHITMPKH